MNFFRSWLAILPLFFPLYLVRFEVGIPGFGVVPTTLLEVLMGVTAVWGIGLWIRRCVPIKAIFRRIQEEGWMSPARPILLFLIVSTVSMLLVPDQTIAIDGRVIESARIAQGIWKGWIVMPIVYFLMVYWAGFKEGEWRVTSYALLGSGVGVAIWALVQMVTGEYRTWDGRASGPFESANYLSLYLGPLVVLALHQAICAFKKCPSVWGKAGSILGVMILALALYGTRSYAAFIAVFAGLVFYGWVGLPARRRIQVALGLFTGLALLTATQWSTPKFQQFLDFEGRSSSTVRLEVYQVAWDMIKEHPVTGIGLGQFEVQYALRAPEVLGHAPYEWVMLHPHNLALAFWLNTGLLGLAAMVWLVAGCFWRGWRGFKKNPAAAHRILLAFSLLVVILVHGLFDTPFFKNDLAYLWWLVVVFL